MAQLMEVIGRLSGPRITRTWVDILDRQDQRVGRLDGVVSWTVTQNIYADIRGQMSLTLIDRGQDIDWLTVRLQPWKAVNDVAWPLGVYIPRKPVEQHTATGRSLAIPLVDKTALLRDPFPGTYAAPVGAVVTDLVTALIHETGETRTAITPSPETVRTLVTPDPAEQRMRLINGHLDSINFFSLWADSRGFFRGEPSRRPQDRPVSAVFRAGSSAIHSPEWSREQDLLGIPNRRVLVAPGDADEPPLIGIAENNDPASPYSIPNRGVVPHESDPEHVEATSQAVIDALAQRRLADGMSPVANLSVQHASIPIAPNAVVRFSPSASHERLAVVTGWTDSSDPKALMTGEWREVLDA